MITLATLPEATAFEVFDEVARHLIAQNEKAVIDGYCVYHGEGGLKCAAGCLIGEDEISDEFRYKTWAEVVDEGLAPLEHHELISELQSIHDNSDPETWVEDLRKMAKRRGLDFYLDTENKDA